MAVPVEQPEIPVPGNLIQGQKETGGPGTAPDAVAHHREPRERGLSSPPGDLWECARDRACLTRETRHWTRRSPCSRASSELTRLVGGKFRLHTQGRAGWVSTRCAR